MTVIPIKVRSRELRPRKPVVDPDFKSRTVLTKEPWTFVSLYLKRNEQDEALFYWEQAREFFNVSRGLPLRSAPLLLYYCYMNAAKALLAAKKIHFNPYHGVGGWFANPGRSRLSLTNAGVVIKNRGVLPSLSAYYQESEQRNQHTLKELFFNMVFVHRTYCLTFAGQTEMFIPLRDCRFDLDSTTHDAYFTAKLSKDFSTGHTIKRLPPSLISDANGPNEGIRSLASVNCSSAKRPSSTDLDRIKGLHRNLREDVFFINGVQTLWYAKAVTSGPRRIDRQTSTLILATMHRLSEICRYHPFELESHLSAPQNWLFSEFIKMSPTQFIDEIASEITGLQFLVPNVRPAT